MTTHTTAPSPLAARVEWYARAITGRRDHVRAYSAIPYDCREIAHEVIRALCADARAEREARP